MSTLKLSLVGFGSRLVLLVLGLTNVVLLARFLEPKGRGEYFLFQTVVAVLTVVADLGLSQSANVFSGQHKEQVARIHGILLQFVLIYWVGTSLVGAGVFWLAGDRVLPNFPQEWVWMAFAVLPMTLYANFWNGMMIGMGRIWRLNIVHLLMGSFQFLLIYVFVVNLSGGVGSAVAVYLIMVLIQFLMMVMMVLRLSTGTVKKETPSDLARQMSWFGLRGYINSVASLLWLRIPIFLLNAFHGVVAVGIFSVAQQLAEKILLPMQAMQDAIYRKMSTLSRHEATFAMNRYLRLVSWGMFIVVFVAAVVAPWVVALLFGKAYAGAAQVFRVFVLGFAFAGVAMILSTYVLSQLRRPGLLSILAGLNVLVCLLLGSLLIPSWAEIGAALALVFTQIIGTAVVFTLYLRLAPSRWREAVFANSKDVGFVVEQVSEALWRKRAKA